MGYTVSVLKNGNQEKRIEIVFTNQAIEKVMNDLKEQVEGLSESDELQIIIRKL